MENRSASEIEESTERLLRDLQNVVSDGEELLRAGVQDLSEKGVAARERLAAALEVAKETRRRLEERAVASAKATDSLARSLPVSGRGIGIGLLIQGACKSTVIQGVGSMAIQRSISWFRRSSEKLGTPPLALKIAANFLLEWQEQNARLTEILFWACTAILAMAGLLLLTATIILLIPADFRICIRHPVLCFIAAVTAFFNVRLCSRKTRSPKAFHR
jgi:ElaB/YqjD/DUF883 family membrane-anchored ribosome-binding protein